MATEPAQMTKRFPIKNKRSIRNMNLAPSYTLTAVNNTDLLKNTVQASPFGSILYSCAVVYDSNTQNNYDIYIAGVDDDGFQPLPKQSLTYDAVVTSDGYYLPPNTRLRAFMYNYGGATANGSISIVCILRDLTPDEQKQIEAS